MTLQVAPVLRIEAQPGPQSAFLASSADIVIYGGAAGGGKTFGLLLEALRHIHNKKFRAVIFRRTTVQIKNEGGLWDASQKLFPLVGGRGFSHRLKWVFPSGATVRMAHMEHEKTKLGWQGTEIPLIMFDEITHFTEGQFWTLVSRNRSTSGVSGYIRGTCNPDPDSWVRKFISWWIDPKTGLAISRRAGVIRWFVRVKDQIHWAFEREELFEMFGPKINPKSVTFIPSTLFDNKILLEADPSYLANLEALPLVEREQLLGGNWNIRPSAGNFFKRSWWKFCDAPPNEVVMRVRYWDRAAGELKPGTDPDATAGVKVSKGLDGNYYIEHVERMFASPRGVDRSMLNLAAQDGKDTVIGYMQDPGSAGKNEAQATASKLEGYNVRFAPATGDKPTRAKSPSAQCEAGNIYIVKGEWNDAFISELEGFPDARFDDQADGLSGAFEMIGSGRVVLVA